MQILTYEDYLLYRKTIEENYSILCGENEQPYYITTERKRINNKHDKCFRDILSDKNEVISFLKDLKKDEKMPYRLLEYYIEILRTIGKKDGGKMPIVIPIIIYTGTARWNSNGYISEKQEVVEKFEEGKLDIKYNLVQVNNYQTDELLKKGTMLAYTMIIENSNDTNEVMENLEKIIENINEKEKLIKLRNIVKYILQEILEKEDIEKIERKIDEKEEYHNMDELIKRIKRNDKIKMKKIVQETRKTVQEEMIKSMLKLGIDKEKIEQISKMKTEEIEKIQARN